MDDKTQKIIKKAELRDTLTQEFEATLEKRVDRFLEVKPHIIIPSTPFSPASSECSLSFRDGHFYGCISLAQAVSEAIVRLLCEANGLKPASNYERNITKLNKQGFITSEQTELFTKIWQSRDDYHHLNPSIERDRLKLEELAKEKLKLLNKIESEIFAFTIRNGVMSPKNPKYWKASGSNVYLRID